MIRKGRLFTPGPTQLLPSAQLAMAAATMHHRTAEFRALYTRVLADLKTFVGTKNDVVMFTASGTGAMEAAVANLTSPGDKVLVVSAGKFGERWEGLAKAYGCELETVRAPYGETVTPQQVREKLKPGHKVLYMQATESSTGVRHDVEGIARLLKGTDTLLVVDAITGLGTTHFDADGWGIDMLIGGSQKAVMVPPGLAYCSVSDRAWQRMETTKNPRYYFDLRKERKNGAKGESSYTPSTALVAALAAALDYIREQGGGDLAAGRKLLVDNAETAAAMTRAAAKALGLKLFSAEFAGRGADGDRFTRWRGFQRHRESISQSLWRDHGQWTGRDEGPAFPHRPPGLLRLSGYHCRHWRAGAGAGGWERMGRAGRTLRNCRAACGTAASARATSKVVTRSQRLDGATRRH